MLSVYKILENFVQLVKKNTNFSVSTEDIEEGFENSTLYVFFENVNQSEYMYDFVEKELTIRMIYFPKEVRKITKELLEVQDKLLAFFRENKLVTLAENNKLELSDVSTYRQDGTLEVTMQAYIFEEREPIERDAMKEIQIDGL